MVEPFEFHVDGPVSLPADCACCLAPATTGVRVERTRVDLRFLVAHLFGAYRLKSLVLDVPHCASCARHARRAEHWRTGGRFGAGAVFFAAWFGSLYLIAGRDVDAPLSGVAFLGSIGIGVATAALTFLALRAIEPAAARAPGCTAARLAVEVEHARAGITVRCWNPEYARRFAELNQVGCVPCRGTPRH